MQLEPHGPHTGASHLQFHIHVFSISILTRALWEEHRMCAHSSIWYGKQVFFGNEAVGLVIVDWFYFRLETITLFSHLGTGAHFFGDESGDAVGRLSL